MHCNQLCCVLHDKTNCRMGSCALLIICVNISSFCVAGCFLLATHKHTDTHTYINIYTYMYIYLYVHTHVSSLTTPKNRSCLTPHQHRIVSNRIQFAWPQQAQNIKGQQPWHAPAAGQPSHHPLSPFPFPFPSFSCCSSVCLEHNKYLIVVFMCLIFCFLLCFLHFLLLLLLCIEL